MSLMTDLVKAQVLEEMERQNVTQADLSRKLGSFTSSMNRLLRGKHGLSKAWGDVLNALGLELIAVPRDRLEDIQSLLRQSRDAEHTP